MYQIKATLRNKDRPESGSVTVQFPIPWKEYDRILEQLKPLSIGGPIAQDCQVEAIDSHYSILKRLEERPVSLDELDYLAKRLDGFDVSEALQFQGAAVVEGASTIQDFINLTFCCQQATVITDFTKLESREVELGRNNDEFIEVLSGLEEGDTVFIQNNASSFMNAMMGM